VNPVLLQRNQEGSSSVSWISSFLRTIYGERVSGARGSIPVSGVRRGSLSSVPFYFHKNRREMISSILYVIMIDRSAGR
jgi:hypothetical protein